ncbi:ribosome recycling factor [bacterium]|nr:ribosome recycling factor [bacterium]
MNYSFATLDSQLTLAQEWLTKEYKALRTGRANPAVLDNVQVSAYGSMMPLNQVATISLEDARSIRITAFDTSLVRDIEKGIVEAKLGLGTAVDGTGIRLSFPDLTTERRQEFVKMGKATLEEARTRVRMARDECWKDIQAKEKEGGMSEDDKFRLKDDMQKKIDATNKKLEELFEKKEKEILS